MFSGIKKIKKAGLGYERTMTSPYPAGSAEDKKLSADSATYTARNRANLAQGVKDVVSGRAIVQGVKVIYRGTIGNALKVEKRHKNITNSKGK